MKLEWLPEAHRSLTAHLDWIADHDPAAALSLGDTIFAAVGRLAQFPNMAREGRIANTRELVVVGTPYVVVYRIEPAAVLVLRVLHGAQRWPPQ